MPSGEFSQDAKHYLPVEAAMDAAPRRMPELSTRQKHIRECFVVAAPGRTVRRLKQKLKPCPTILPITTPLYTLFPRRNSRKVAGMPHGGLLSAASGSHHIVYSLKLIPTRVHRQRFDRLCLLAARLAQEEPAAAKLCLILRHTSRLSRGGAACQPPGTQ
ncbi:MAG: hypothetical protein ACLRVT_03305 [Oscillospiraceae bacterium]